MPSAEQSPLKPIVRLITTHNSKGEAIFEDCIPSTSELKPIKGDDAFTALTYATSGFPIDLNKGKDLKTYQNFLQNPPGLVSSTGTVLRHVDIAPSTSSAMHRTVSLDYGVVIEGEIELVLDSGEAKLMRQGDVAIQRGTIHLWRNPSKDQWCRMMYVLQPCLPVEVDGKRVGENLGIMEGFKASE